MPVTSLSPNRGGPVGGTQVLVSGSGFTGATQVTFDGTPGTGFFFFDDTLVIVTTPAHAVGVVDVIVDVGGTLVGGFTYVRETLGVNPAVGGPNGGINAAIFGNGFTGASAVTFGGVAATSVVVVDDNTITCDIPAHAPATVDVTVTGVGTLMDGFLYDTQQWSEVDVGTVSGSFRDSLYVSGDGFLFVGDNGLIYQSVNGLTGWTARTSPAPGTQLWKGIAYSPALTRYCVVGNGGAIATSDDGGATWTTRTSALATQLSSVCWSPTLNLFCSVSTSGTVQTSPDGITWTARTASVSRTWLYVSWSETAGAFAALASNAGGATNCIMSSPDGTNWTTRTNPAHSTLGGFGRFIATDTSVGFAFCYFMEDASNFRWLVHSNDGFTWTKNTMDGVGVVNGNRPERIIDAPGLGGLLCCGIGFNYHVTLDGVNWVETVIPSPPINFVGDFALSWAEDLLTNVSNSNAHSDLMIVGVFTAPAPSAPTLLSIDPDSGPVAGGTTVTITGTNFPATVDDFAITFDGAQASNVVRVSDTEITCDTPPHAAGPVDVIIASEAGNATLAGAFTYLGDFAGDSQLLSARRSPAIRISHQLNSGTSSLSFAKDGVVDVGETIFAKDPYNDRRIFTGPILKSTLTFDDDAIESHVSTVSATDKRWFLDKKLPYGKWEDEPVATVVAELLASFAPDFSAEVEAGLDNITLDLNRTRRLSEVFTDIAGVTGSHYRLDSETNKVILGPISGEEAPDDITDDTDCEVLLENPITKDTDLSQIRTRVYVFGKNATGSDTYLAPVRPSSFNGDVDATDFDILPGEGAITIVGGGVFSVFYQLSAITDGGEAFMISGANARQWAYYWDLPTPSSAFAVRFNKVRYHEDRRVLKIGLYRTTQTGNQRDYKKVAEVDNDPVAAVTGGPGQYVAITDTLSELSLTTTAPDAPTVNDTATVVAMREDLVAQAALAALEGGDGVHEYAIFDSSIITLVEAEQRGDAELELFKNPLVTVSYSTRDEKSKVGREVTIDLTDPPIAGTFKIQSVDIDQIHESNILGARYRVTASSQRFTLSDLFHRLANIGGGGGGGGGGSSSVTGGTGASGGPSGWAATADKLTVARDINGVPFDGSANIDIDAGPQQAVPTGSINGANTVFTVSTPYQSGRLYVYLNGVRQKLTTDFTETTSTTFTMVVAPTTGDVLTVDYVPD